MVKLVYMEVKWLNGLKVIEILLKKFTPFFTPFLPFNLHWLNKKILSSPEAD